MRGIHKIIFLYWIFWGFGWFCKVLLREITVPPHRIICPEISEAFSPIGSMNMVVYSITYKNIALFVNLNKNSTIHVGQYTLHWSVMATVSIGNPIEHFAYSTRFFAVWFDSTRFQARREIWEVRSEPKKKRKELGEQQVACLLGCPRTSGS